MSAVKKISFGEAELTQETYKKFSDYIYRLAGVNIPFNSKNEALLKNRLGRILRTYNMTTYEEYWQYLQKAGPIEVQEFISCLTTNMTSFFREAAHFTWFSSALKKHFEKLFSARIWCAAASTGQEPYTIAIVAYENLPEKQRGNLRILASDIDVEVLKKAALGRYKETEMGGLSKDLIFKYFDRSTHEGETIYRVKDFLRETVQFSQFNLIDEKFEFKRPFDFIFCRNVLIYFDSKTVSKVIENLASSLNQSGYLLLGHSESGNIKSDLLRPLSQAIYERKLK